MPPLAKTVYSSVDEFISKQPVESKPILKKLREIIRKAAPDAEEVISYQMPAFKYNGMLVWYAAYKNHYALYPMPGVIKVFSDKLKSYEKSKGTIRFPLDKPIPVRLITDIVKFRIKENLQKKSLKEASARKKTKAKK